jgi:hypothetical protein
MRLAVFLAAPSRYKEIGSSELGIIYVIARYASAALPANRLPSLASLELPI